MSQEFKEALIEAYLKNPCQVLANPLWKTLQKTDDFETAVGRNSEGYNRLEAWDENSIYVYWRKEGRQPGILIRRRLETCALALIHQDFLDPATVAGFNTLRTGYYRLSHDLQSLPEESLPEGFSLVPVKMDGAMVDTVAAFIAQHSDSGDDSLAVVQGWVDAPVFASKLWLWVMDAANNQPVGLAVAALDPTYREAVIEWVQVHPDFRKRGLGKALVTALLRRIQAEGSADFVTASGEVTVEERDEPGQFFRHCGFTGTDVWWLLSR